MSGFIKKHHLILIIILAAIIIRVAFAYILLQPKYTENEDLVRYHNWGGIAYYHGIANTYSTRYMTWGINNQPPGTAYIDLAMFSIYQSVFQTPPSHQLKVLDLFLKIPSISADIFIGLLIYYIVRKYRQPRYALLASSLFLFNPVIIYNSAVWGQTDALNNLLLFLSLVLILNRKYFFAVLALFLSFFIKLSLLPLLPLVLFFVLKSMRYNYFKLTIYTMGSITLLLIFTRFVYYKPLAWIITFLTYESAGEMQHITNNALNFWSVIFNPDYTAQVPDSSQVFYGLSLSNWAYILFCLAYIPVFIYLVRKKKIDQITIFGTSFLVAFASFILLPRMHERYLYPVFALMAVFIGLTMKSYISFIILTLVNFINLYTVWHPSNFIPLNIAGVFYHSKIRLAMSSLTTLIFIILYAQLVMEKYYINIFTKLKKITIRKSH